MRRRVLVRTEDEEFGRNVKSALQAKGAKVRVTPSLNEAGHALVRGDNPFYSPHLSYGHVLLNALGIACGGARLTEYLNDRIANGPKYDFVVFDPMSSRQQIDRRFLDPDMRPGLDMHCIDGVRFPEDGDLGLERNYLGRWHHVPGSHIANLPDEFVYGLAFMQQLKNAGRYQWNGHPRFNYVFASNDRRIRGWANLMQSLGFVDYSTGLDFEHVEWVEQLDPNQKEALGIVADYLSSGARAAMATSMLTVGIPTISLAQSTPPQEIKITANNSPGKSQDFNCFGYWVGGPSARVCMPQLENPKDFTAGMYLPLSQRRLKIVGSNLKGRQDFGAYFNDRFGDITAGAGFEFYHDIFSGEAHAIVDVPLLDHVYAGYNFDGDHTIVLAAQPDIGDMRFALIGAVGETDQLKASAAMKGRFKFFYTKNFSDDPTKRTQLFNGLLKLGNPNFAPYLEGGMAAERFDITQAPNVHTAGMLFNAGLFPENTHLSDHGWLAFAPRYLVTHDGSALSLRGFYTHHGRFIAGYALARNEKNGDAEYIHTPSAGVNIGPFKVVGSYDTGRGPGFYVGFKHKVR